MPAGDTCRMACAVGSNASSRELPPRRLEILQIRRRLVFAGGHEVAVGAEEVVLLADDDLIVALHARALVPFRPWIGVAAERLVDAPGPRQSMVVDGDLVVQDVGIVLVEMKALLDTDWLSKASGRPVE